MTRSVRSTQEGAVHALRQVASSDHERVSVVGMVGRQQRGRRGGNQGQELKPLLHVDRALDQAMHTRGDPQQNIRELAQAITQPKRSYRSYRESTQVKLLRRQAKQTRDGQESRMLWKRMWRLRAREKEQWQKDLLGAVLRGGWQEDLRKHFEGIFAKMPLEQVRLGTQKIWDQLQQECKGVRWRPFSTEELMLSTQAWAKGKSTGPDSVSYEALRLLLQHPRWEATLLEEFNDALYKRRSLPIWSLILSVCPLTQRQGCCTPSAASLLTGGA